MFFICPTLSLLSDSVSFSLFLYSGRWNKWLSEVSSSNSESMISKFDGSMLPKFMVTPMAYSIPIAEVIIGAGILLGIKTKLALTGNALLMFTLIFGCCMIENFNPVNSQMLVLFISTTLIATVSNNRYTLTK